MKKILLPIAAAMIAFTSSTMAADKVRIGTEGAYAPWNFMDDKGKLAGFEIELGTSLCERAKLECEFVVNEWDSIIPNMVAGNYDMIMAGMSVTDERKKSIAFSDEYYPVDPSRYVAVKGGEFDFDNLKDQKIGVQGGTVQAAYAEENFKENNTIKSYEKPDQAVADLAAGNIDILLADGGFLDPIVKGSGGHIVFVGSGVNIGGGIAIGLRKKDTELTEKMNAALAEAKKDGTVDKLISKFFDGKGPFYSGE
ncbi:MAG: amino acid ABC transporter [Proteobacteria bacterium]|nr:MAG: amino acid ABC transporter [Pseudomonadota bacterium]